MFDGSDVLLMFDGSNELLILEGSNELLIMSVALLLKISLDGQTELSKVGVGSIDDGKSVAETVAVAVGEGRLDVGDVAHAALC